MYGEMGKDQSKSVLLPEFVEYYSGHRTAAHSEYLEIEDDGAAPRKHRLDTGNVKLVYQKKEEFQAPGPSGTIGELFKQWSGAGDGQRGSKKANSVDFKEFTAMLKSLNLTVDRHKAQEIFRQVRVEQIHMKTFHADVKTLEIGAGVAPGQKPSQRHAQPTNDKAYTLTPGKPYTITPWGTLAGQLV